MVLLQLAEEARVERAALQIQEPLPDAYDSRQGVNYLFAWPSRQFSHAIIPPLLL
jgi:hypothetical protein